jgi:catechol 2,3-dioxygenase-like lactoylglutathione lyase family enzyme
MTPATSGAVTGLAGVLLWTAAERFAAMARFYTTRLGLMPRTQKADFVNFDWGGVRLSIGVHDGVAGPASDPLRVMVNLEVDDIRAVHARLAANGVLFSRPPEREAWGGWVATFADPDGNTVQLMELPRPELPAPGP